MSKLSISISYITIIFCKWLNVWWLSSVAEGITCRFENIQVND